MKSNRLVFCLVLLVTTIALTPVTADACETCEEICWGGWGCEFICTLDWAGHPSCTANEAGCSYDPRTCTFYIV